MLRRYQNLIDKINVIFGGAVIFLSFLIFYQFLFSIHEKLWPFDRYFLSIGIFVLIVMSVLQSRRFSVSARFISTLAILRELFAAYIFGILGVGFAVYIFKLARISRIYMVGGVVCSYVLLAGVYSVVAYLYKSARKHGMNFRNVLIAGCGDSAAEVISQIKRNKALGLNILGLIGLAGENDCDIAGFNYLGRITDIKSVLNSQVVDYVIFTGYSNRLKDIENAIVECKKRGIEVWLVPQFMYRITGSWEADYLQNIPLFVFSLSPKNSLGLLIKRLLDIVTSAVLLVLLLLPMFLIFCLVRLSSRGSAFFRQRRIGLNGREFIMYKFRTMYPDSVEAEKEYDLKNEMRGPVFKMRNDPRITSVGRLLRRFSLDELPQLWNVLIGQMSLVGPRPPLSEEVNFYEGWQRRRLSIRPGITGLWQVTGRDNIREFQSRVKLDLEYIDKWNLWLDIAIFFKTFYIVVKGTGM